MPKLTRLEEPDVGTQIYHMDDGSARATVTLSNGPGPWTRLYYDDPDALLELARDLEDAATRLTEAQNAEGGS